MKLLDDDSDVLPQDAQRAALIGRLHDPDEQGPAVVAVRGDRLVDLTATAPTLSDLLEHPDPVALVRTAPEAGEGASRGASVSVWAQ